MAVTRFASFKPSSLLLVALLVLPDVCQAKVDWLSFTWDNDIFVGEDNGYTNGGFWTWFNVGRRDARPPEASWLVKPLMWSMPEEEEPLWKVNAHTFGHMMVTPEDITRVHPDPNDLPYSGLAYYMASHLQVYATHADLVSVTVGLIGPNSGAESVQKYVHKQISGADEPMGWHHQLDDEVVFRFSRSRVWRNWRADSGSIDFLTAAGINVGTLESSVGGHAIIRYGTNLGQSYATAAYHGSRAINPVALNGGWHMYAGLSYRYVGNLVFTDGNSFEDSPSVEADESKIGFMTGFSYSWHDFVVVLAVEDMAMNEKQFDGIERYGTFTVAYRFE